MCACVFNALVTRLVDPAHGVITNAQIPARKTTNAACIRYEKQDLTSEQYGGEREREKKKKHPRSGQSWVTLCMLALRSWLRGLPPQRAYRSQQAEETVTHAFVSTHVH